MQSLTHCSQDNTPHPICPKATGGKWSWRNGGSKKPKTEVRILAVQQSIEIYDPTGPGREKCRTCQLQVFCQGLDFYMPGSWLQSLQDCGGDNGQATSNYTYYGVCKTVMVTMGRQHQIILTTGSARLWWRQRAGNVKLYLLWGLQGCDGDNGQAMSNYITTGSARLWW